jgi:hypothetical protein
MTNTITTQIINFTNGSITFERLAYITFFFNFVCCDNYSSFIIVA